MTVAYLQNLCQNNNAVNVLAVITLRAMHKSYSNVTRDLSCHILKSQKYTQCNQL